ncbi:MAG: T9SS type A sorting domain-containing protein, partial [Bacteroidales bacterium]|nr:T9SS type A sorting domain-containing protein [Bacteroidales bacterium]
IHFVKVHTGVMEDGKWLGEISTEITGAVVVAPDTSVSGVTEMVVVRDLPQVIDTSAFQLEAFAFDMGRWQPERAISWTSDQSWATVGQDGVMTVTQSGPVTLTAYLADKPEIETSVLTTVEISPVSGIKNNTNPVIRIWPNPASDMIRIEGFKRARVSIYTVSGVRVLVRENYTGGESIRLADLPEGLYIVRISSGRDSATAPLIKQ